MSQGQKSLAFEVKFTKMLILLLGWSRKRKFLAEMCDFFIDSYSKLKFSGAFFSKRLFFSLNELLTILARLNVFNFFMKNSYLLKQNLFRNRDLLVISI